VEDGQRLAKRVIAASQEAESALAQTDHCVKLVAQPRADPALEKLARSLAIVEARTVVSTLFADAKVLM
jgi:hypothetical protein